MDAPSGPGFYTLANFIVLKVAISATNLPPGGASENYYWTESLDYPNNSTVASLTENISTGVIMMAGLSHIMKSEYFPLHNRN